MTIAELVTAAEMRPFQIAFGIVAGLLLIEIVLSLLGLSGLGGGDGAHADLDAGPGADFDGGPGLELDTGPELYDGGAGLELDGLDVDGVHVEGLDMAGGHADAAGGGGGGSLLSWLGAGAVPLTIWMASLLTAFTLTGFAVQAGLVAAGGAPLAPGLAAAVAALPALLLGRGIARGLARLLPSTETTAISTRSYGRRRGVITVGTATAEKPAQVRFTDRHGNMHYAMVTPFDPHDSLPQGTEVLIVRVRDGSLKAVALSD